MTTTRTTQAEKGLRSTEWTAEYIGTSVDSLRDMRRRGAGPRWVQHGRLIRYRPADIEAWVKAGLRGGAA